MELVEPKFLRKGYGYYDNDGLKVKEDAPEWAKKEYSDFMNEIIVDYMPIEEREEEDEIVY